MRYAVATAAIVGAALATPLTTIQPCPSAPTPYPEITVTKQFQEVSTCVPTSTCKDGSCSTGLSFTTSLYVSTIIPCAVSGTKASSCTVTKTDQVVPCSEYATTITNVKTIPTAWVEGTITKTTTKYETSYQTISKEWSAPFNKIGPLGIPGYEGSGICEACEGGQDGSRSQYYDINECHADGDKQPECHKYPFTYVSTKAPSATAPASAVCSSKAAVDKAGTYVYTFHQVAPETTITAEGAKYTVPAQPWYAYVTKTCNGPTTFDFAVTVTKTITYYHPQPKTPDSAQQTDGYHWGDWKASATTTADFKTPDTNNHAPSNKPWDPPKETGSATWSAIDNLPDKTKINPGPTDTPGEGPAGESFAIKVVVNPGQRFRKRSDTKFIGFTGSEDGTTVAASAAALFHFDNQGALKCNSDYINSKRSSGYIPFEKVGSAGDGAKFQCTKGSPLTLAGASFCVSGENVIISFGSAPGNCVPANLICGDAKDDASSTSTTTKTTSVSTTKSTTFSTSTIPTTTSYSYKPSTTTSILDISADLDAPEPTGGPKGLPTKRGIRGYRY